MIAAPCPELSFDDPYSHTNADRRKHISDSDSDSNSL
jgi:hypothetical protein